MKYRLHIAMMAMAAAAALTSCSDSYPGIEYTTPSIDGMYAIEGMEETPLMVFINEPNIFNITATRGTGPFDRNYGDTYWDNLYEKSDVYVYAFRKGKDTQGITEYARFTNDASRWYAYNGTDYYNGKDCLLDGDGYHGMRMRFSYDKLGYLYMMMTEEESATHEHMRYFSKIYQESPYDFFAYYVDMKDGLPAPERTDERVTYTFDIDGSQDIMSGYAPFKTREDIMANEMLKDIPEDQITKILNIGGFSTYAAHRGIYPVVDLKHQLTRLNFRAYPGDQGADAITIAAIGVVCNKTCRLVVASRNTEEVGAYFPEGGNVDTLRLKERSVDGLQAETEFIPVKLSEAEQDGKRQWSYNSWRVLAPEEKDLGYYRLGSSLMVPTADEYTIVLWFYQPRIDHFETDAEGNTVPVYKDELGTLCRSTYKVKLKTGTFEKGYVYPITIAIYGYEAIKVSALIEPWHDGGGGIFVEDAEDYEGEMDGF